MVLIKQNPMGNLLSRKNSMVTTTMQARDEEKDEIDVIWDENGTARYRILKDKRLVDFDGHNLAWLDEQEIGRASCRERV